MHIKKTNRIFLLLLLLITIVELINLNSKFFIDTKIFKKKIAKKIAKDKINLQDVQLFKNLYTYLHPKINYNTKFFTDGINKKKFTKIERELFYKYDFLKGSNYYFNRKKRELNYILYYQENYTNDMIQFNLDLEKNTKELILKSNKYLFNITVKVKDKEFQKFTRICKNDCYYIIPIEDLNNKNNIIEIFLRSHNELIDSDNLELSYIAEQNAIKSLPFSENFIFLKLTESETLSKFDNFDVFIYKIPESNIDIAGLKNVIYFIIYYFLFSLGIILFLKDKNNQKIFFLLNILILLDLVFNFHYSNHIMPKYINYNENTFGLLTLSNNICFMYLISMILSKNKIFLNKSISFLIFILFCISLTNFIYSFNYLFLYLFINFNKKFIGKFNYEKK